MKPAFTNELAAEAMSTCPGCGLVALVNNGPCDPNGGSSPACWATFNAVTAKNYGEYQYPDVHRLIVDAYMSQHATFATPAGRRFVVVHSLSPPKRAAFRGGRRRHSLARGSRKVEVVGHGSSTFASSWPMKPTRSA